MSDEGQANTAQNVISLESHRPRQKRSASQIWNRERERRYAGIVSALEKSPKMASSSDRRIVATNLGEILERFEREGKGKKEAILRAVNMGEPGNSTKQLFNYALPLSYSMVASRLEKRISKLVKRIDNYASIAKKAAELAGWEARDVLIDLFKGSSYDYGGASPAPDLPDYLFSINGILQEFGDWLVRVSQIDRYYKILRTYPVWDDECVQFIANSRTIPNASYGSQPLFYGKSIPGIPLYRILSAQVPIEFISGRGVDSPDCYDDEPPDDAIIQQLTHRRYFEVRLGIAPTSSTGKIGLVFDSRCFNELWNADERVAYSYWFPQSHQVDSARWDNLDLCAALDFHPRVLNEDTETSLWQRLDPFQGWIRNKGPLAEFSNASAKFVSDDYLYFPDNQFVEEIDARTCKKYLDIDIDSKTVKCYFTLNSTALECPINTIAARVESNLYSDDVDGQIDGLLKAEIEHRCSLLDTCLEHRRIVIDDNRRKLFSRWGVD